MKIQTRIVFVTEIDGEEDQAHFLFDDYAEGEDLADRIGKLKANAELVFQRKIDRKNGVTMLDKMCRDAPELAQIRAKAEADGRVFVTAEDPHGLNTFRKYLDEISA